MSAPVRRPPLGLLLGAALLIPSCASVSTRVPRDDGSEPKGVLYYLPKRLVVLELTIPPGAPADKPTPWPVLKDTPAMPDPSQAYVLDYQVNLVGKNHMKVGVSPVGLLTSADADTVSGLPSIAASLGKLAGTVPARPGPSTIPGGRTPSPSPAVGETCPLGGTYAVVIDLSQRHDARLCNFAITVRAVDGGALPNPPQTGTMSKSSEDRRPGSVHAGYFYRQDRPYLVNVADRTSGAETNLLATSPDLSPVAFLPISRSFFSDNATNVVFRDGALASVDQHVDGEITAAVKLPADFLDAYMSALGGLFKAFGNSTQAQTTLSDNQRALALSATQRQACNLAIQANQPTIQVDGNTVLTPDRMAAITAATQAIKSACAG